MTFKEFEIQLALGSLSLDDKLRLAAESISRKALIILSKDKDVGVRWSVAANSSTPKEVLKILSTDEDIDVRWRAMNKTKVKKGK